MKNHVLTNELPDGEAQGRPAKGVLLGTERSSIAATLYRFYRTLLAGMLSASGFCAVVHNVIIAVVHVMHNCEN